MFHLESLPTPKHLGSYPPEDVIFLLKDLSALQIEKSTREREVLIQQGAHYSEMLPTEHPLSGEYYRLFYRSLEKYKPELVTCIRVLSQKLVQSHGEKIIFVSLARAGTPIGVLLKRALKAFFDLTVPHYSISIIIGKGFDETALKYILAKHPQGVLQFVDGWTGKGTIKKELQKGCDSFNATYGTRLSGSLAVLADPCGCAEYSGTTKDLLIPSSLLNSTVSGLISRTIHREDLITENDFHGVKVYHENAEADVSNFFVDELTKLFANAASAQASAKDSVPAPSSDSTLLSQSAFDDTPSDFAVENQHESPNKRESLSWVGLSDITEIQKNYGIENIHLIKPGLGETTRVLLRRIPRKILVHDFEDCDLLHLFHLAKEKNVPVEKFPLKTYRCCGIIQNLGDI